jgi:hypothetical protein
MQGPLTTRLVEGIRAINQTQVLILLLSVKGMDDCLYQLGKTVRARGRGSDSDPMDPFSETVCCGASIVAFKVEKQPSG